MAERTLSEIAEICGATLVGDGRRCVVGPAGLAEAGPEEVSFLADERYRPQLEETRAAAVIVRTGTPAPREDLALLCCEDPNSAFSAVVRLFAGPEQDPEPGVHPSAVVHPRAELGAGVSVGPNCTVGAGACVGDGTVLHPGVVLYPGVRIGARCTIHAGAVIGSEGFGFEPTAAGWEKIPQCGTVVVEDDVEIGANATVDRARFGATHIGRGAKLDNLVQVAHNCVIGPGALLCAQSGMAGSVRVGAGAILAGQVGISGHLEVGDGARVGAKSGVFGNLAGGAEYLGYPARPRAQALRAMAAPRRMGKLAERLEALEARIASMEEEA
ncbi:MAG: UDP-3-O-(3-hydroxymyristoyl)glucosamine N-acyltransferase [Planctomycetota bacterium]|jgi:UDP-3-O-[3-hydroxymyristoyl] glucosamine N-acyltransferase|nr:UDP-3-O-(3-hydroxymyristoyl)glucosamine N-acyltransferase [Planctomycetota bacterium]MDP6988045.1 UDP-3-O-(3-hydroxymyristoyl)glucosamine N-acyltransferase [Planctomycetota bacterium]